MTTVTKMCAIELKNEHYALGHKLGVLFLNKCYNPEAYELAKAKFEKLEAELERRRKEAA